MTNRDHSQSSAADGSATTAADHADEVVGLGGLSGGVLIRPLSSALVPSLMPWEEIPQRRPQPSLNGGASGDGGDISR